VNIDERAARLTALFTRAPLGRHLGMVLSYDAEHRTVVELEPAAHHNHALGEVHGGVIATLIDTAAWFTAAVHYDTWLATVEFQTRLLEPVSGEKLIARGAVVRTGKSLAIADAEVRTTEGRLIALGSGTFTVTSVPIE
jgi:uncharacterized protein (TIGR00369 family)